VAVAEVTARSLFGSLSALLVVIDKGRRCELGSSQLPRARLAPRLTHRQNLVEHRRRLGSLARSVIFHRNAMVHLLSTSPRSLADGSQLTQGFGSQGDERRVRLLAGQRLRPTRRRGCLRPHNVCRFWRVLRSDLPMNWRLEALITSVPSLFG
jgi:hypothetical protein